MNTLIISLVVCGAVIYVVRMLLEHRERDAKRRERLMNTPLERFSDNDEAERLAQRYLDNDDGDLGTDDENGRRPNERAGSPLINITINKTENSHNTTTNTNSNNGPRHRCDPIPGYGRHNRYGSFKSPKSKGVAFALCLFMGFFGAHYFYCHRFGMGFLYLLTIGLFGIGWLVDLFRIPFGKFTDDEGRRL